MTCKSQTTSSIKFEGLQMKLKKKILWQGNVAFILI